MATHEPRHIDWGSAQIQDGTLTVELTGASAKAWSARFKGVLVLLDTPHSNWGKVSLTKKTIKVADVQQGSQSELRHLLESAVLQANSDTASEESGQSDSGTESQDDASETQGDPSDYDRQMTAAFRSFASG